MRDMRLGRAVAMVRNLDLIPEIMGATGVLSTGSEIQKMYSKKEDSRKRE